METRGYYMSLLVNFRNFIFERIRTEKARASVKFYSEN